jgi:alkanesulfonate monooxygenase SsuD/methylene tetrahydromethanopterin reductase-like flavin-dependent oxidoreductase (luciferase family)
VGSLSSPSLREDLGNMADSDHFAADSPTSPDRIDPRALAQIEFLPRERVARCWRTAIGFLVMTNLRCVHVWRKPELFAKSEWHTGPNFFFYNLASPQIVAGRFLQLSEEYEGSVETTRFLVRNPREVAREIEDARAAGRAEWRILRSQVQHELDHMRRTSAPPGTTLVIREVVKVRCSFCGNLMDVSDTICPTCGAPQK